MTETTVDGRKRFVDTNVPGWVAARRYGVPASMVERATARRLAGDWLGACAAAAVDVRFDLGAVRDRHGAEIAGRLHEDLVHFAPDLLRWHAPRHDRGGCGLLLAGASITLADYGGGVLLRASHPAHLERPQRIELRLGQIDASTIDRPVEDWRPARYLWDARTAAVLRQRLAGGDRVPFFHRDGSALSAAELAGSREHDPVALTERVIMLLDAGEIEQAWRLGGITADFSPDGDRWRRLRDEQLCPQALGAMVPAVAWYARAMLSAGAEQVVLRSQRGWGPTAVGVTLADGELRATRVDRRAALSLTELPRPLWQRFPDLEILRTGALAADELHPLVRSAMFPDQPDPGYHPRLPSVDSAAVAVRCRGAWHRVGWRDGRTAALNHTTEEEQRERVMRSLGGQAPACFTVAETWRGTADTRLPAALRRLRTHGLTAVQHGHTGEFVRLLDAGVDPAGLRDRWGRTPLHLLARLGDSVALLPRLLAAGLTLADRDRRGRTPLGCVAFDGGSAALIRAMLDAGADPLVVDDMGISVLHLLRTIDGDQVVRWLVEAGVGLDTRDGYGRTPLISQVFAAAPVETVRATLNAGADPTIPDEYTDQLIDEIVSYSGRERELEFLVAAYRAAAPGSEE